jgi:hypothetical protein
MEKIMSRYKPLLVLLLLAANVTGVWNLVLESQATGTITSTFVLTQKQNTLTGSYKGQRGEFRAKGIVKDPAVSIVIETPRGNMTFTGKLDNTGRKFAGKFEGAGTSGTFTATKAEAKK